MQRILQVLFILLISALVIIQFFQPKENKGTINENHIFQKENIPGNIKEILTNACLDCHSNNTNYLWYHKIAPVSWMVNNHVIDGKKHLNFSDWGDLDTFDKIGSLDEICDEVADKKMPIKAYIKMHKKAKLSEEQILEICAWTEKISEELLKSMQ